MSTADHATRLADHAASSAAGGVLAGILTWDATRSLLLGVLTSAVSWGVIQVLRWLQRKVTGRQSPP
jgi:hypothetical protein